MELLLVTIDKSRAAGRRSDISKRAWVGCAEFTHGDWARPGLFRNVVSPSRRGRSTCESFELTALWAFDISLGSATRVHFSSRSTATDARWLRHAETTGAVACSHLIGWISSLRRGSPPGERRDWLAIHYSRGGGEERERPRWGLRSARVTELRLDVAAPKSDGDRPSDPRTVAHRGGGRSRSRLRRLLTPVRDST